MSEFVLINNKLISTSCSFVRLKVKATLNLSYSMKTVTSTFLVETSLRVNTNFYFYLLIFY